jgi:hypothetical protein
VATLKKNHISFSELKNWNTCPYYHKLVYVDGIKVFDGNEHTAFGTAMHDTCEQLVKLPKEDKTFDAEDFFKNAFLNESRQIEIKDKKLLKNMYQQGPPLIEYIIPALEEYFGEFELISTEERLYEDTDIQDYKFKGFIDLVLQTSDGKYHIIDWKTCSWGWDAQRKNERMTTYQLTLYKNYWAKKHGVEHKLIETHFALLKRTAKNNKVELFRVTSGAKKMNNALNLLEKAIYNITSKITLKNKLSCKNRWGFCDFYNTEHCS